MTASVENKQKLATPLRGEHNNFDLESGSGAVIRQTNDMLTEIINHHTHKKSKFRISGLM